MGETTACSAEMGILAYLALAGNKVVACRMTGAQEQAMALLPATLGQAKCLSAGKLRAGHISRGQAGS